MKDDTMRYQTATTQRATFLPPARLKWLRHVLNRKPCGWCRRPTTEDDRVFMTVGGVARVFHQHCRDAKAIELRMQALSARYSMTGREELRQLKARIRAARAQG